MLQGRFNRMKHVEALHLPPPLGDEGGGDPPAAHKESPATHPPHTPRHPPSVKREGKRGGKGARSAEAPGRVMEEAP